MIGNGHSNAYGGEDSVELGGRRRLRHISEHGCRAVKSCEKMHFHETSGTAGTNRERIGDRERERGNENERERERERRSR